jgi:hypothetical protein
MTKTLVKIVGDEVQLEKLVQRDQFLQVVNTDPPAQWVKDHPIAKNIKYMPIERIELLLTRIFQEWRVEILREGQLANSIYVTVRLHYKDPIDGEWRWQDGTGAAPIKTDKGENASNMAAIKNDAVMTGLPAAESFAIKDAAEKIGRLFGKDLNRKDVAGFVPNYDTLSAKVRITKQKNKIKEQLDANN